MGTFTIKYFLKKAFIERPWWYLPGIVGCLYADYRYMQTGEHRVRMMCGQSKMFKDRREEILRWDPKADIWKY